MFLPCGWKVIDQPDNRSYKFLGIDYANATRTRFRRDVSLIVGSKRNGVKRPLASRFQTRFYLVKRLRARERKFFDLFSLPFLQISVNLIWEFCSI